MPAGHKRARADRAVTGLVKGLPAKHFDIVVSCMFSGHTSVIRGRRVYARRTIPYVLSLIDVRYLPRLRPKSVLQYFYSLVGNVV